MATNNLFLGTGRGVVGDVVLYRRNGKQTARVRVRNVGNPQTQAQATQRALFAPVARFYAPLSQILETAWEGKNKSESYSAFLKRNLALARSNSWMLPKDAPFYPFPYEVSHGTIRPLEYFYNDNLTSFVVNIGNGADQTATVGVISQRLLSVGYQSGDQITFILAISAGTGPNDTSAPTWIKSFRYILNSQSEQDVASDFSDAGVSISLTPSGMAMESDSYTLAGLAVIISRYENGVWRRSTQQMELDSEWLEYISTEQNVASSVRSYMKRSSAAVSSIYLNGGTGGGSQTSLGLMNIISRTIPNWGSPVQLSREEFSYGDQKIPEATGIVYTALNGQTGYMAYPIVRIVTTGETATISDFVITLSSTGQWSRKQVKDVNLIVSDGGYVLLRDDEVAQQFMLQQGMPAALLTAEGITEGGA